MSAEKQWAEFLTPAVTQERLISASLYITAYEMLKDSIIGRLKDFYCIGFDQNGPFISPDYQKNVLNLNKSALYASLKWLESTEVINETDLQKFEELKQLRNLLAHELPQLVFAGKDLALLDRMRDLMELLRKIEVWWVINVEIATDPDFDGREINPDEVTPGPVLMMQLMFEVLSGNESLLEQYKEAASHRKPQQP